MRYSHSPVSRRRKVEEQLIEGAEKKAKTENGCDAPGSEETNGRTETDATAVASTSNGHSDSPRRSRARAASHEPHGFKSEFKAHAKHFLDEHPSIRSFSNSLTRKGKSTRAFVSRSLERAKSMADKQIDKAKVQVSTLRRRKAASEPPRDLPEHKILNLRESPRLCGSRDIPAYVVRQPSDDAMDVTDTEEELPFTEESTVEASTVVPDEIIEIPSQPSMESAEEEMVREEAQKMVGETLEKASEEAVKIVEETVEKVLEDAAKVVESTQEVEKLPEEVPKVEKMEVEVESTQVVEAPKVDKMEVEEERYEIIEPPKEPEVKAQPPPKAPRKKKEHHYEDIDDYVPPKEQAAASTTSEAKLVRQHEIDGFDPIIGEMLGNDKIKISLQLQDQQIANDMLSKKKRLDEILQHSSEDEKEKDKIPSLGLLAPISSIDSTSSDEEARRTHLSTLAEESDTGSIDNSTQVTKKPEQPKKPVGDLSKVEEDHKEEELTPAEENLLAQQATADKQLELTPAEERMLAEAEQKPLNTDASPVVETKAVIDERWSKMR